MTNQSDRQADARSSTGTTLTYEGDSLAYFDSQSVPAGDYNGRLLAWINQALGTSYTEINGAKTALANNASIPTWDGLNLLGRAGGDTPYLGTTGYRFASGRLRSTTAALAPGAGNEFRIDVCEFWSPAWPSNNFRAALPSHYTSTAGTTPSEFAAPNAFNIEGVRLMAFITGAWQQVGGTIAGSATATIDPATNSVGVLTDDFVFGAPVPANTRMQFRVASNVAVAGLMITGMIPSQASGRVEGAVMGATTQSALLTVTTSPGVTGRLGGGIYTPSFIVAKPTSGLDRAVLWCIGDSKTWGKNEPEGFLASTYLASGFLGRALDDDVSSRRMPYYMCSIPGAGAAEWKVRSGWNRKLDLIKLVPNRPYTHMVTDHYNNGNILLAPSYRADFGTYYSLLQSESVYWGDRAAPLYQTRPIPRAGSTDWCTTLVNQNPAGGNNDLTGVRWAGFDADLLAQQGGGTVTWPQLRGVINTNDLLAYDQSTNRDKFKLHAFSTTFAAAYTANATTCSLNALPSLYQEIVIDPTLSGGGSFVRAISGTGPYTITLGAGVNSAKNIGDPVLGTYSGDNVGLHPPAEGHVLVATPVITWKNAQPWA